MTTSRSRFDVVVVGAGPAGLAATARAASAGLTVALVDNGNRLGGQYWRQPSAEALTAQSLSGHEDRAFLRLSEALDRHIAAGRVARYSNHHVWAVERSENQFLVNSVGNATPAQADAAIERRLLGRRLVLATGAYDRQLPFPGWTLPGVLTAGGAQALLKGHGVVAGRRVLVAGTGPFLLPVAAGLVEAGAHVVGVHEAAPVTAWLRHAPTISRNTAKIREGIGYVRKLARHGVPVHTRSTLVSAHGNQSLEAVTVARSDGRGNTRPGSETQIEVDTLAVGWGFTPQLELALSLRCATRVDLDGSLICNVDDSQQSSVPGVYVVGEGCGVGGAELAVIEGEIAGASIAGANVATSIRRRRTALRRFAEAMHKAHPVPEAWMFRLEQDTIICRCEEVSAASLRRAVEEDDASDARSAKLLVRTGMGWCQGRVCGYATSCLTARWSASEYEATGLGTRPVSTPVRLGTLAKTNETFPDPS